MISRKLKLLSLYAGDFLVFSLSMTLLSFYVYYATGVGFLTAIIWFKIMTSAVGILVHQERKSKELFFYMNNGLGKKELMIITVSVDFVIWLFGMICIVKSTL